MTAYLRYPLPFITLNNFLFMGAGGHVFTVSSRLVLKCPTVLDNASSSQKQMMEDSAKRIEREKEMYKVLTKHRHPNILRCVLTNAHGLFLERMDTTLQARVDSKTLGTARTQARWISQITSAMAWLEKLGYVHGDLRPPNILLTADDNIRIADFDSAVRISEELIAATEPFCKVLEGGETPEAGAISEQYSVASCIYTIRFGCIPHQEVEWTQRTDMLTRGEFPDTKWDILFGDVTLKCWMEEYPSLEAVDKDVRSRCSEASDGSEELAEDEDKTNRLLLAECNDFLDAASEMGKPIR